jgi:hypothetical protein
VRCPFSLLLCSGSSAIAKETTREERAKLVEQELLGAPGPEGILQTIDGQQIDLFKGDPDFMVARSRKQSWASRVQPSIG